MMNYNYDVLNNTLTVSENFLKNAGKYNSAEYNVVKALRADNPNMQIVVEKRQKSTQKNLTFKQMKEFIMKRWNTKNWMIMRFPLAVSCRC